MFFDVYCLYSSYLVLYDNYANTITQVFHLKEVWSRRQDPYAYKIACVLLGKANLWVDINRRFILFLYMIVDVLARATSNNVIFC